MDNKINNEKKHTAPGKKKYAPAMNTVVRTFSVLDILKEESDIYHPLKQDDIVEKLTERQGGDYSRAGSHSAVLKTVRTDLRNLIKALNDEEDVCRIAYRGIEEGKTRMEGIHYVHEFSNAELQFLCDAVSANEAYSDDYKDEFNDKIKRLGSNYYQYSDKDASKIQVFSTLDKERIAENCKTIEQAMANNKRISFVLNCYDSELKLRPVYSHRTEVNPYQLIKNGQTVYLIATIGKYENVLEYRVDLMTDVSMEETPRESIRSIPALNNVAKDQYMCTHPDMSYGRVSSIIRLRVRNDNGFNAIKSFFGDHFDLVEGAKENSDTHTVIQVTASESAVLNLVLTYGDRIEILKPNKLREKLVERAEAILEKYKTS